MKPGLYFRLSSLMRNVQKDIPDQVSKYFYRPLYMDHRLIAKLPWASRGMDSVLSETPSNSQTVCAREGMQGKDQPVLTPSGNWTHGFLKDFLMRVETNMVFLFAHSVDWSSPSHNTVVSWVLAKDEL